MQLNTYVDRADAYCETDDARVTLYICNAGIAEYRQLLQAATATAT